MHNTHHDVVGRLIPLGQTLRPPRLIESPPTLKGIIEGLAEPADHLEELLGQYHAALQRNDDWRCSDHLDQFTQSTTREALLTEFAFASEVLANLRAIVAGGQEVLR